MRTCVVGFSLAALLLTSALKAAATTCKADQPSVVRAVAPVYPHIAAVAGASGTVIVEAHVDARGVVMSVRTVQGLRLLGAAAENSARLWVFTPASGQSGVRVVRLTFTFKLMPSDAAPEELSQVFMLPYHVEVRRAAPRVIDNPNIDPPISRSPSRPRKRSLRQPRVERVAGGRQR